jgi:GAF domain
MARVAGRAVGHPRELEDLREQQRAISRVLRAVARLVGIQPVLEEVAEECRRLCEADHGSLWLLQDGLLHVGAHGGQHSAAEPEQAAAAYDVSHPHPLDRTTAAGRAALERRPVHIPDVLSDPEYTYPGPRFFRTMLGVPISIFAPNGRAAAWKVNRAGSSAALSPINLLPTVRLPPRGKVIASHQLMPRSLDQHALRCDCAGDAPSDANGADGT